MHWTHGPGASFPAEPGTGGRGDDRPWRHGHAREAIELPSQGTILHGVLRLPDGAGPHPGVVLIHGSLEQDRDGNMVSPPGLPVPPHPFLRELGTRLTTAGFAALSWDKRGFGASGSDPGSYWDQAADAAAALDLLGRRGDIRPDRCFVFGQSAGVFVASILAGRDRRPRAYVLSGGLGSSFRDLLGYNSGRIARYAARSEEHRTWVGAHNPRGLVMAANLERLLAAVDRGDASVTLEHRGVTVEYPIDAEVWHDDVHARMVRNVSAPTLVIHGGADLNVPVSDADLLVTALRDAGNADVRQVTVPGVDHSFQEVAPTEDERLRERLSLTSFERPYREAYFAHVVDFLHERM